METTQCKSHHGMESCLIDTEDHNVKKCSVCEKTTMEMFDDLDDIDPTTRVSQQPHGKSTGYCNMCQGFTARDGDGCVYHQKTLYSEEGAYLRYDEFDQDGEAY